MSSSTRKPDSPEKESWLKQKFGPVETWKKEHEQLGLKWLLLLTVIAFLVTDRDLWFIPGWLVGLTALAWRHVAPAVKWYCRVDGTKSNARWFMSRLWILASTTGLYTWLAVKEGPGMGLLLLVVIGISIRLVMKADFTMLGAIIVGILMVGEHSNGAAIGVALFATALVEYERRKFRRANLFVRADLPEVSSSKSRPYQDVAPAGGGLQGWVPSDARDSEAPADGTRVDLPTVPPRPSGPPPTGGVTETGQYTPGKRPVMPPVFPTGEPGGLTREVPIIPQAPRRPDQDGPVAG